MTTPEHSPSKEQQSESLEDRVDMLFEELALAVKWQRPSILLAIYASDLVCAEAQLMLEKKLVELGQRVSRLTVNSELADIPMFLSRSPEREKTVFFVRRLKLDSRQGGHHAYRALNIRRELLVDHRIRVVFWITEKEAAALPVHAPDFWAFRHRVIEFLDPPAPQRIAALAKSLPLAGSSDEMIKAFKKAVKLEPKNVNLLSSLGDIYIRLNRTGEALQAFRKATRLDPKNADLWVRLGDIYRSADRMGDARKAYRAAISLEPNNRNAQAGLASCSLKSS
jgi:tetratricopeptide (TPR) repeat protein